MIASTNDLHAGACQREPVDEGPQPAGAAREQADASPSARPAGSHDWERRDPGHRPHAHLGPFGVEPELQGRGIGSLVLTEYTRRLDAAGEDSYLETEKPENVALYSRFGFEVIEEAEVLGVPNWFMWRDAGADAPIRRECRTDRAYPRQRDTRRLPRASALGELLDHWRATSGSTSVNLT